MGKKIDVIVRFFQWVDRVAGDHLRLTLFIIWMMFMAFIFKMMERLTG